PVSGHLRLELEEAVSGISHIEQAFHPLPQPWIVSTGLVEEDPPLFRVRESRGGGEEQLVDRRFHRPFRNPPGSSGKAALWRRPTAVRPSAPRSRPSRRSRGWSDRRKTS